MGIDTAIILCGGKGSRFRKSVEAERIAQQAVRNYKLFPPPRTSLPFEMLQEIQNTPKCLVPLCGKPLLWHKINQVAQAGVREIILCAGKNSSETRECIRSLSWASPVSIRFCPQGLFTMSDLTAIMKSLKGRRDGDHVLITAGDCLTNTDYSRLIAEHEQSNRNLTIAVRSSHGDHVFTQDAIASHSFLRDAARHTSRNLSNFPHNSPLTAAIHTAWHNHELNAIEITTAHLNMNTISDYEALISDPERFVPLSLIGQPRLCDVTPSTRGHSHSLRP